MPKNLSRFSISSKFFRSFQIVSDSIKSFHLHLFRSLQTVPHSSSVFFQILLDFHNFLQIPFNSFRIFQFLSDPLRFSQILSNSFIFLLNFPIFLKFSQIPSNSSRFFHFLSDSLFQILSIFFILSDYSGCFSMLPNCFRFFGIFSDAFKDTVRNPQIFQFCSDHFRSAHIFSDICRFFQIFLDSFEFFQMLSKTSSGILNILSNF